MAEQTLKEQIQEECKDKDDNDVYDVYDVDCDDGTVGDKVFVPKNKMRNIKNK